MNVESGWNGRFFEDFERPRGVHDDLPLERRPHAAPALDGANPNPVGRNGC